MYRIYGNFIDGQWQTSISQKLLDSINPATGEVVAHTQDSTVADVDRAVTSVRSAFQTTDWGKNSHRRAAALAKWADAIDEHANDLAAFLTAENGKPIREARVEIQGCSDSLRYYSGMARNVFGRTFQPAADNMGFITREPVGVVAMITPWNWPALLLFRDLAPALAAGNGVVVKPADRTGAITARFFELLEGIDEFSQGILALVTGRGATVGNALVEHRGTDMICFTGSTQVGVQIMQTAARQVKKVALELGGKSPNIVFDDADLEKAITTSCRSLFMTSGQICMAGSRLLVHESIYEDAIQLAKAYAEQLEVGDGALETTDMGPIISETQMSAVLAYIEDGRREGRVVTGGNRLSGPRYDHGFFVAPTVIADLPTTSRVIQEEIFGPVLAVQSFQTEQEAIQLANGTAYGLTAGVWAENLSRAMRVAREIQAGTVWVNGYNRNYAEAESGGFKSSGIGRTRGIDGLLEFTEAKHINITF
ncbi:aldehyde dehydrogenase family protein [Alicyclobacillus dauci]|uniref:Aldehyde dehydrogenase family protein n=1 Tax=Alicyclobacillus dauci TaxID=1475485 RepID=A0ABY6Z758_9BACL|nr:aldehyde dehydrogenase family protein [Alicyclobacillus dauci]WAH38006.1 aldehyde dehydrogenase family protein [Alicyclobacillus dauci]